MAELGTRGSGVKGLTLEQRLWRLSTRERGPLRSYCWVWNGYRSEKDYGRIMQDGRLSYVHRVAWELFRGPVPDGLQLDHLCRNPPCWRPDHLEPVSALENHHRSPISNGSKTHCPQGHLLSGDNLYEWGGRRYCRACHRVWIAKKRQDAAWLAEFRQHNREYMREHRAQERKPAGR